MSIFATPIIHKVLIKSDRKKVFDNMTTAEGLDGWFTNGAVVDQNKIIFNWVDWGPDKVNTQAICPIIEIKTPERFVFKWWEDHYTTVEFDFIEVEEGTVVSVKEYGYADTLEGHRRCLECAVGWGETLTLLKFYCEYGLKY
ncbi:MAG: SRPBCC domain-containing protein [Candidatus Hodarchaeota archaeon]